MAASGFTVRVSGLRELQAALKTANGRLDPGLKAALKAAAEPVRAQAQAAGAGYSGMGNFVVVVRARGVNVEQSAGTVTGRRGDFGSLQQNTLLEPALAANTAAIESGVERAIDVVIASAGL